ncbi:phytase [Paraglaciecola aquimarina]|uniref:Phytase n=1 Tax=Paraglaciecola algarum TaxID=3050085 RepID=A0ABS9D1N6_9ALTE|nr:phytase [Paraglaciecola sp. G1-23]MCF2946833.1 phytase [Paraglaciecola sp. G1-23]
MKSLYLGLIGLGLLAGCQTVPAQLDTSGALSLSTQVASLDAASKNNITGKSATPVMYNKQTYWLLTSESQGVVLTDANGKVLSLFAGNMEALDWRDNIQIGDKSYGMITTLDNDSGQILVLGLDWQNKQLSLLKTLAKTDAQVEAVCWYKMPQGHLSVFIANTLGSIEQRILVDGKRHSLVDQKVHDFIGAPETKACAVDDTSASLYVVEANIGVWRYSADPESELYRDLVSATKPFGSIDGEVTDVEVLTNGDLLISAPEQQGLWLVDISRFNKNRINKSSFNKSEQAYATYIQLKGSEKPETVSALQQGSSLLLGLYDDETEQYFTAEVTLDLPVRLAKQDPIESITAFSQTDPVSAFGDAADDPAIWVNSANPQQSRVLGTNKKQGMLLYDLQGNLLQQVNIGRVNNVDLRYGFSLGSNTFDIAAASNRTTKSISLFAIQPDGGEITFISDIPTDLGDVYGLCMYQQQDKYYVFINDTDGRYQQYLLVPDNNQINGRLVREFQVPSQPEGCVADDLNQQLYFGEESTGIWQVTAEPVDQEANLIAITSDTFVADVEGMGIYHMDGKRYLVASSQGNNSFGVFALDQDNQYLGSFRIDMDLQNRVDGVSETDGLEITQRSLGAVLPDGLLVVQDGRNRLTDAPQNFKLVDGTLVKQLIKGWLKESLQE